MTLPDRPFVLLIGPPNVGKSVIFNYFTGMNVSCANYPGTTVEYAAGRVRLDGRELTLIDVPGIYTLNAANEAERAALDMLSGTKEKFPCPAAVLFVLDAHNLENSLYLLLRVLEFGLPVAAALNRCDLAEEKGESIDTSFLAQELGIPVISTVAVREQGFKELYTALKQLLEKEQQILPGYKKTEAECWQRAEELTQKAVHKEPASLKGRYSRRRKWGLLLVKPWPGIPLALLILGFLFAFVIGLGMGLRQQLLLPLFREIIIPQVVLLVQAVTSPGLLQNILIGKYGFLVKGLEWPFALVLPYVISFYIALSFLEDSGYMSRLGGLLDGLLNKVGLHGSSIIPLLLGYGCGVPAIISTRTLGSSKERLIVAAMVCLTIPCIAQTGAFIALLAEQSVFLVLALFLFSVFVLGGTGLFMDRFIKGPPLRTIMEIPELLLPRLDVLLKKVWTRVRLFVANGALPMIGAIGIAAFLFETGIMEAVGLLLRPLVSGWLGLPQEAAVPLILGILRRELTVLPLLEMDLTSIQLFVGAVVGLLYVPCIAIIATLGREFGLFLALAILLTTSGLAFLAGGVIFRLGSFIF